MLVEKECSGEKEPALSDSLSWLEGSTKLKDAWSLTINVRGNSSSLRSVIENEDSDISKDRYSTFTFNCSLHERLSMQRFIEYWFLALSLSLVHNYVDHDHSDSEFIELFLSTSIQPRSRFFDYLNNWVKLQHTLSPRNAMGGFWWFEFRDNWFECYHERWWLRWILLRMWSDHRNQPMFELIREIVRRILLNCEHRWSFEMKNKISN